MALDYEPRIERYIHARHASALCKCEDLLGDVLRK